MEARSSCAGVGLVLIEGIRPYGRRCGINSRFDSWLSVLQDLCHDFNDIFTLAWACGPALHLVRTELQGYDAPGLKWLRILLFGT